jgi:AcrR family transcriptional regulator
MRLYERFLRKAPKQSRSRSVVEAVLDAAAELLPGNDADDAVTLNDIATRAGVGVGSLYDYFADRGSVLSGLVAKVTEDNLRRFEKQLEESRDKPLEGAVREIINLMFDTYAGDVRIPRAVLRVAHRAGLMPTIADSQMRFSSVLARALAVRDDVRHEDPELAAYVVTNMAMGIVHTSIWAEQKPFGDAHLRAQVTTACCLYLAQASVS